MIKLLMAIAVICVLMTAVGIIYCYIIGIDPARLDEGADNSISVDYRYFGEGINKGIAIAVAEKYEETFSLEKRRHKMTNFEKIKNEATLDDLAFMLMCPSNYDEKILEKIQQGCPRRCVECTRNWLKEEVQDD